MVMLEIMARVVAFRVNLKILLHGIYIIMRVSFHTSSLPKKIFFGFVSASRKTGEKRSGTRSAHLIVQLLLHEIFGFTADLATLMPNL
jgi:hypothetical protein